MLKLVESLVQNLNENEVSYCHWKSNRNLDRALAGVEDLDLLIARGAGDKTQEILGKLGFRLAEQPLREKSCSIFHYYGHDESSGIIVHLHIHFRLITGGAIVKNFRFPIEDRILASTETQGNVRVSSKPVELLLLVVRKSIESASLLEMFLLWREKSAVMGEIEWLTANEKTDGTVAREAAELFDAYFPGANADLFETAFRRLSGDWKFTSLWKSGCRMRRHLRMYTIDNGLMESILRITGFSHKIFARFIAKKRTHTFQTGGTIIAVTGPDATGKSTVVGMLYSWLANNFSTETAHTGKPPSSLLTYLPNRLMPMLRKRAPGFRTGNIESDIQTKEAKRPKGLRLYIFAIRSLMIAHDRKRLLLRISRNALKGGLIVCDRYPSPIIGAMDSIQIDPELAEIKSSKILSAMANIERRIYQQMPPADVVIQLTAPVEVALERNSSRNKAGENDAWVRRRHFQSRLQKYDVSRTIKIDTQQPLEETLSEVKREVWKNL
jgi:thymidylate kinase